MQPIRTMSASPTRMREVGNSRKMLTLTALQNPGMVTEKSCNLLEY